MKNMMRTKLFGIFQPDSVSKKTNSFYYLFMLSCFFSVSLLPWIILNSLLKFSIVTFVIYALVGVWVFPNIQTLFSLTKTILMEKRKVSFREYCVALKKNLKSSMVIGVIGVAVIGIVLFELVIILKNKQMLFFLPVFGLFLALFSASLLNGLYINTVSSANIKQKLKISLFMGWRSVLKSLIVFCLILLWISLGYFVPIVNILLGNTLIFYLIYIIVAKNMNKIST